MSRPRGPNLAHHPIVREVVEMIDSSGWADWQVSEVAGVSLPYISQLRGGKRHDISVPCLNALLGVFGRELKIGKIAGTTGAPKHRNKPSRTTKKKIRPKLAYAGAEGRSRGERQ